MDGDAVKMICRSRKDGAFAMAGLAAVVVMVLGIFAVAMAALSNQVIAQARANRASSEQMTQVRRTNSLSALLAVEALIAQLPAYYRAAPLQQSALAIPLMGSGVSTQNILQGPSTAVVRSDLLHTTTTGSGESYTWVSTPPGLRTIFGGRPGFVGREIHSEFTEAIDFIDPLSGVPMRIADARRVTVYEFPANSFAASGNRVRLEGDRVAGSVLGEEVRADAGSEVAGSLAVNESLHLGGSALIGGTMVNSVVSAASAGLSKQLEAGAFGSAMGNKVGVFYAASEEALFILSDPTSNVEGIPQDFRRVTGRQPDLVEAWSLPAYQCRTRVYANLAPDPTVAGGFRAVVEIRRRDDGNPPASWAGEMVVTSFSAAPDSSQVAGIGLSYLPEGGGRWFLVIDPVAMAQSGLSFDAQSVFIEFRNAAGLLAGDGAHAVGLRPSSAGLAPLAAFSLVTPNRLHIDGNTNDSGKPVSIFSPEIRFGIEGSPGEVRVTGQRGTFGPDAARGVGVVLGVDGLPLPAAARTVTLGDITDPAQVPPVVIRGLMVLVRDQ